ncbi:MAG: X2-like carbohydrate binding domain-containing protein [Hespellia sp.]|nr:X2-like carbohydrate binding domain-containing protein [Hespellia sp.]
MKKAFIKRCSAGLLAMMMMVSFMPAAKVLAADPEVWVNGVNMMTPGNSTVSCGEGTAEYNADTNTLTLTNAQITKGTSSNQGIMIQNHSAGLQIVLTGKNTIASGGVGISTNLSGDVSLSGGGSLEVTGPHDALGINGNLTIDGVTITGNTSQGGITVNDNENITIKNKAKIDITASYFGLSAGDLTITDSEVKAIATGERMNALVVYGKLSIKENSKVSAKSSFPALYSKGDMSLYGSEITATSSANNAIYTMKTLLVDETAKVTANGYYAGLRSNGDMTINGTVESTSSADNGIYTPATLTVGKDANVTTTGNRYCGINATQGITIHGMVTANSPQDAGIFSPQAITITDTANVTVTGFYSGIGTNAALSVAGTVTSVSSGKKGMSGTTVTFSGADSVIKVKGKEQALSVEPTLNDSLEETGGTWESADTEVTYKAHTHTASTEWSKDVASHWHECTANDGEKMDKADHTFGDWVVDTEATETAKGSKHRECTVCGQRETAEIPVVVKPENPVITSGAGSAHQVSDGKDMTITCSGKLEDLTGIYVDGKLVDKSNYSLQSESTILTLKASYLDTLSAGKHTLRFQYKDGLFADTTFTITAKTAVAKPNEPAKKGTGKDAVKTPKTGDTSNVTLLISLLILSGGAIVISLKRKKACK